MASFHPVPPVAGVTPDGIWPSYPPFERDVHIRPEAGGRFPPFCPSDSESARKFDLKGVRADDYGRIPRTSEKRSDGGRGSFGTNPKSCKCPITMGWNTIQEPARRKSQLSYSSTSFAMYGTGLTSPLKTWTDPLGRKHETYPKEYIYIPEDTFYSTDRLRFDEAGRLQSYGFMPFPYQDWNPWIQEKYRSVVPIPSPSLYNPSKKYSEKSA